MLFGACLALFAGNCIYHACEKELPAEYHGNWKLEQEDANKVRFGEMSKRQFIKNMNNGKYYAPSKPKGLDTETLEYYLGLRKDGLLNMKCDYKEYNFIKELSEEEAKRRWYAMRGIEYQKKEA